LEWRFITKKRTEKEVHTGNESGVLIFGPGANKAQPLFGPGVKITARLDCPLNIARVFKVLHVITEL
jgi:hypothetical protein